MKTKEHIQKHRAAHHAALVQLSVLPNADGLKIWRKLRQLEKEAHDAATAQCNGEAYGSQPFRPDWLPDGSEGTEAQPTPWDIYSDTVRARVVAIFGKIPEGFRFNQDPRGYALKIDPEKGNIPHGMQTDWGGNGTLAAEID